MIMHGTFATSANATLATKSAGGFHSAKNGKITNIAQ